MKITLTTVIKQIDGVKPLLNQDNGMSLTLRDVCSIALLAPDQKDEAKQKFSDYEIFKKVRDAKKEVELTAEEIVRIKKKIGIVYAALILGQAYELLEKD